MLTEGRCSVNVLCSAKRPALFGIRWQMNLKIVADQNIPYVVQTFSGLGEVRIMQGREMRATDVRDADLLLVRSTIKVNRQLLEGSRVRFVATATIGFDHVDTDYLSARGIGFASAAGSNANSVAEYVACALLEIAERQGTILAGKSLGVVGVGNVGSKVVRKAEALGMNVVQNDPPRARASGDPRYRPLDEALACDFVTFHVPLTREGPDATYRMVNAALLSRIKKEAVLLNSSRGNVVVEDDLKAALRSGHLSAAILDVWADEPHVDAEMIKLATIGTPHIAGYSLDGKVAGTAMVYKAACEFFGIKPTVDVRSFLPPPQLPRLAVGGCGAPEKLVRDTVRRLYDIRKDDAQMRTLVGLSEGERAKAFDNLRRTYRDRREFFNTVLVFESCPLQVQQILLGLGFSKA
jgi:erythronate-4-phosphate dehydrogenase